MKNIPFLLIAFLLLASCKPLMLKLYQIKDPKVENKTSILKTATRYGIDTSEIFTVAPEDFIATLSAQPLPDIDIFDNNGTYIEYRSTDTPCNSGLFDFIPTLRPEGKYNKTEKKNLQEELKKLRDINGNLLSSKIEKADFYLLVYWTVWIGKLNRDHVKVWEQLARDNKNCKIKVLKVNLDIQESWPATTKQELLHSKDKKK